MSRKHSWEILGSESEYNSLKATHILDMILLSIKFRDPLTALWPDRPHFLKVLSEDPWWSGFEAFSWAWSWARSPRSDEMVQKSRRPGKITLNASKLQECGQGLLQYWSRKYFGTLFHVIIDGFCCIRNWFLL